MTTIWNRARAGWLAGPAAASLFAASVTIFAALRQDGYTHGTKAVSELGSTGAPNALAFNLLGFVLPGLLVMAFAAFLTWRTGSRTGGRLLALSGACLCLAGLAPVDMAARGSMLSILHLVGAMGSGFAWTLALFPLGRALRRAGWPRWGRITPWFGLFLFANVGWQVVYQSSGLVLPGWGQRIAFLGYFAWLAITGLLLRSPETQAPAASFSGDRV